jgi:hypothetical protein
MKIQDKIKKGEQAKSAQGAHRVGAPGEGAIDRRSRRAAWAADDQERAQKGLPPRGVVAFRVLPEEPGGEGHHG